MSDTRPGAHRADDAERLAVVRVAERLGLVSRSAEGNPAVVAHDQAVIFAGRQSAQPLTNCTICGRVSGPYWWRWRAYRLDDPEFGDLPRVAVYCQSCADRKFGPPRRRPLVERRQEPRPKQSE